MFFEQMHPSWQAALADQRALLESLESICLADASRLAPTMNLVMRALETPLPATRVLILGQDPYPTAGDAIGLAFAVSSESRTPASLRNILTELRDDLGDQACLSNDISVWQERGVLLLNRHLTTLVGQSEAHTNVGWSMFTDAVIQALAAQNGPSLVAILWGNQAQTCAPLLAECSVIASPHPSPLSARRGFFGSKPFSRANSLLIERGLEPIDWSC